MSIRLAIETAHKKACERKWDKIFVAVDWHDTICASTYSDKGAYGIYEEAISALHEASKCSAICLILYTSSYKAVVEEFIQWCKSEHGIVFEYFNCNPEVKNSNYGDFDKKFYYDVIIDDKAGFDPNTDWAIFAETVVELFGPNSAWDKIDRS